MFARRAAAVLLLLALAAPAAAADGEADVDGYDGSQWTPAVSWEAAGSQTTLLADIEEEIGSRHRKAIEVRIERAEEAMRPIFLAMARNEYGNLGHSSVRYVLHRYFVGQHGWFIEGLFSEGAALNETSPVEMLKHRVPLPLQGSFEKRLGGRGFGLHDMAVLAALVEHSVHEEAQHELLSTYGALGVARNASLNDGEAATVIETYMTGFIMRVDPAAMRKDALKELRSTMKEKYPTWPRAQVFFHGVRANITAGRERVRRTDISAMVGIIVDSWGVFQGTQCLGLKKHLAELEGRSSPGCVRLADFYKKGLKNDINWLFVESQTYLRHIGVLDETNPRDPQLLTANYINNPSNCLQPSGYYLVCCHNECDDILGHLEGQLATPRATVEEILAALPGARSAGVSAVGGATGASLRAAKPGWPTPALRRRLGEVAAFHGGYVPLHGRLFAQWLHHAFPQECPYPHLSGTKNPEWMDEFEAETGKSSQFSVPEMRFFVRNMSRQDSGAQISADVGSCAPWQHQEELFAPLPLPRAISMAELEQDPHVWRLAASLALLAAVVAMVLHMLRVYRSLERLRQPKMLQI